MKFTKRLWALLLCAVLMLGVIPFSVSAEEILFGDCGDNAIWVLDDTGTLTITGTGAMEDKARPWSTYQESITQVVIGEGITHVGEGSFYECKYISSVSLPSTLLSLGHSSFSQCDSLTQITIPESVQAIDSYAFYDSALETVHIPAGVTSIGTLAFSMETITSITVAEDNPAYASDENGILYTKDMSTLVQAPAQFPSSSFTVPSSVTTIGDAAFRCSSLTSIDIPGMVTTIACTAFAGAQIANVTLHEGLTTIENHAFFDCSQLTSIAIPASVQSIGVDTFRFCDALEKVSLPHTADIKSSTFDSCYSLKYVFYTGSSEDWTAVQDKFPSGVYVHYNCEPMSFDHDFSNATCTTEAPCKYCDVTGQNPNGHAFTNYVSNENATCTEDGTKTAVCDHGCGTLDTVTDVGSALGHDFTKEEVSDKTKRSDATTEAKATYWYTCRVCEAVSDTLYFEYGDLLPKPTETTEATAPSETTKPTEAVNPSSPQTGDNFALGLALALTVFGASAMAALVIKRKEI